MNKSKTLFLCIILFAIAAFALPTVLNSQIKFNSNKNTFRTEGIYLAKTDSNLQNFPFRFGLEFADGSSLDDKSKFQLGFITSIEFNLFSKICFLKLEFGRFFDSDASEGAITFVSLGINYKIFKIKKNSFYIQPGIFAMGNKAGGGMGLFLSARHVLAFNKYIGLASSVKYPYGSFKAVMLTIGVQFFTD